MKARLTRRHALLLAASLAGTGSAWAQADWPSKPVRIVVPFAPGGTTDLTARIVAEQLGQSFKQTFVVENKAGAGGNVGANEVAKAAPDGYTFLMGTPGTQAINQFLYAKMPYDTAKDLVPVSFVVRVPNVMMLNPGCRRRTSRSSSRWPRPSRAGSPTARRATAPPDTCRPSCSRPRRACSSRTSRTAAAARCCRT